MFTESNTVEQMVIDACVSLGWRYAPAPSLPRQPSDVFVEPLLRQALIRLNPEIAAQPDESCEPTALAAGVVGCSPTACHPGFGLRKSRSPCEMLVSGSRCVSLPGEPDVQSARRTECPTLARSAEETWDE
jgi:hypothetical protein